MDPELSDIKLMSTLTPLEPLSTSGNGALALPLSFPVLQNPFGHPHFTEGQIEAEVNKMPRQVRGTQSGYLQSSFH